MPEILKFWLFTGFPLRENPDIPQQVMKES